MSAVACAHGLLFSAETTIAEECQQCDWCPTCEGIREYDGETCTACGYVWGEG